MNHIMKIESYSEGVFASQKVSIEELDDCFLPLEEIVTTLINRNEQEIKEQNERRTKKC